MKFQKAEKKGSFLRVAIHGPVGSGCTYGCLSIASGMAKQNKSRFAMIDTEKKASLYADTFDFDVCELDAPFSPSRYIELIDEAKTEGYQVLVMNSMSRAWAAEGGFLDMHQRAVGHDERKSFTAWKDLNPIYHALIHRIVAYPGHVICGIRSKEKYEIEKQERKDKNGKVRIVNVPVSVGIMPVLRGGFLDEFGVIFALSSPGHLAYCQADVTKQFEGHTEMITEKYGAILAQWVEGGATPKYEKPAADGRVKKAIESLSSFGLTQEQIEKKFGKKAAEFGETEINALRTLYGNMRKGNEKNSAL